MIDCEMARRYLKEIQGYLPQIYASVIVCCVYMAAGMGMVYSSVLIPQIHDYITDEEQMWIVNCVTLVLPIFAPINGLLADTFGRLWVLKVTLVPHVAGWTTIALAKSSSVLIIGRAITGVSIALQSGPCFVYISEVTCPNIRGALLTAPAMFYALGTVLVYFEGYLISWQIVAWTCCAWGIVATCLLYTLPNSPSWLISKNRVNDATRSLEWLSKRKLRDKALRMQFTQKEIEKLQREQGSTSTSSVKWWRMILLPTVYKPLLIITVSLLFQQLSGINVILMNAVIFLTEIGITIDPYLASTYMAIARLGMMVVGVWLTKLYGRRPLLMGSFISMAISMGLAGLFTKLVRDGITQGTWIAFCMLLLYSMFNTGAMVIPFALSGECFPLSVRGMASGTILGIYSLFTFASVSSYPVLLNVLGGVGNLQYFYAMGALIGGIFTFFFVPETLNRRLFDIETYFWSNSLAVCSKKASNNSDQLSRSGNEDERIRELQRTI